MEKYLGREYDWKVYNRHESPSLFIFKLSNQYLGAIKISCSLTSIYILEHLPSALHSFLFIRSYLKQIEKYHVTDNVVCIVIDLYYCDQSILAFPSHPTCYALFHDHVGVSLNEKKGDSYGRVRAYHQRLS